MTTQVDTKLTSKSDIVVLSQRDKDDVQRKNEQNLARIPKVLFHSSPRVVRLTLEAQGVLLYNSQKQ